MKVFPNVVDYAFEIVQMHQRIQELEAEVAHLECFRDRYFELVDSTQKHGDKMWGIMLAGALGDVETAKAVAEIQ